MQRTYQLILTVECRKMDPAELDEIVANVVEYSTAREAIETGLDGADVKVGSVSLRLEETRPA
jgi:hypothetical protein